MQVVCHVGVLSEPAPKTWIEKDMLAGPKVETMESVKLYLGHGKEGANGHNPQLPGAERECREELNMGPECPCTSTSRPMTVNSSTSGAFQRCSPPLAAALWDKQSGYLLVPTHITYKTNIVVIQRVNRLEKGQFVGFLNILNL